MGDPFEHMRRPGFPPPARPRAVSPDEIEPVPCAECGCIYRKVVEALKHMRHRISGEKIADSVQSWYLCLGCKRQVDTAGTATPITSPDRIPAEVLKEVLGE